MGLYFLSFEIPPFLKTSFPFADFSIYYAIERINYNLGYNICYKGKYFSKWIYRFCSFPLMNFFSRFLTIFNTSWYFKYLRNIDLFFDFIWRDKGTSLVNYVFIKIIWNYHKISQYLYFYFNFILLLYYVSYYTPDCFYLLLDSFFILLNVDKNIFWCILVFILFS